MEYIAFDVHKQFSSVCKINSLTCEMSHHKLYNSR
jgi:hypothetical protein